MIAFAEVSLGVGGLPACTKCGASAPPVFRPASEIESQLAAVRDGWSSGPGPNVSYLGAEPFLHPELPVLVMAATAAGYKRVRLRTGAVALAAHENAAGVVHAGVRHIEAVMLAAGSAHDELSGIPGGFAGALSGLAAFRAAADAGRHPVALTGLIPACRHNLEHLPGAVAALAEAGAVSVEIALSPTAAEAVALRRYLVPALDTGTVNGVWVSVSGATADTSGIPALHTVAASTAAGSER